MQIFNFTENTCCDIFITKSHFSIATDSRKQLSSVGLPLSRGSSNRVRSTSRGGRSPSAPSKAATGAPVALGAPVTLGAPGAAMVNGAPGRGRRSRSVSKVGIKLGA